VSTGGSVAGAVVGVSGQGVADGGVPSLAPGSPPVVLGLVRSSSARQPARTVAVEAAAARSSHRLVRSVGIPRPSSTVQKAVVNDQTTV